MNFVAIDLSLLGIFVIFISIFLYVKRKNLNKEGLLFLYRTKWGMKLIDKIGSKYKKTLSFMSYVSIGVGYILMASVLYLIGKVVYIYTVYPQIVRSIKIPPITPLVPYLPQVFKLDFLPPFYFTYWIVILAIIAITHEFMHGIFMRRYDIKIKSTGFGFFPFFFPVFLAAFVEQDEKSMEKSSPFNQMAVLAAGTFANIVTAILFFGIIWIFFTLAFVPAGAEFNTYSYSAIAIPSILSVNNVSLESPTYEKVLALIDVENLSTIKTLEGEYLVDKDGLESQENSEDYLILYDNSPAIRNGISGAVTKIDENSITDWDSFGEIILNYSPGDNVTITTLEDGKITNYEITLGQNPKDPEKAWIGVGYIEQKRSGLVGKAVNTLSSFKKSYVHYESKFESGLFVYNLLWWLVMISASVALMNMLPMGIFDGGRFFYLTILVLTRNEKKAERWFKISTNFFLLILVLLMVLWVISFIG